MHLDLGRRTRGLLALTLDEVEKEARILHNQGFRHILLLTGEAPGRVVVVDFAIDDDQLDSVSQMLRTLDRMPSQLRGISRYKR